MTTEALVEVSRLTVEFLRDGPPIRAVNCVSFSLRAGRTLAIVGESGSGKSVTATTLAGLGGHRNARISGQARIAGLDMVTADDETRRRMRGHDVAMVFQDPMTSLNPFLTAGEQIATAYRVHHPSASRKEVRSVAIDLLHKVGIPNPSALANSFPHQLSGGTRQRIVIAMAVANRPRLLIADEPTTALDVTVQAQILDLLAELQEEFEMALLMITHDLGVVAAMADEVAVMYGGRIVEAATCDNLFANPTHPYTVALLDAASGLTAQGRSPLRTVPGQPASAAALPPGCAFSPRCPHSAAALGCTTEVPELATVAGRDHQIACHLHRLERTQE